MDESSERTIERLRPMIPDIDQLWDRSLPLTANLSQLSQRAGGRAVSRNEHDDLPGQHVRPAAPKQSSLEEATSDALRRQILCDLQLQPIAPKSPLCELQEQVQRFFQFGPLHAGGVFNEMSHAADRGTTVVDIPDMDVSPPWNSCKAAATLVALFACQADRLKEVRRSQRRLFGDMPTLEDIRKTPNTSLQDAFQKAKSQARNDSGHTTVLAVTLTNVHIFELAEQGRSEGYTSYAHVFVMGIGPEGVIIWQGWGAQGHEGYGLDQWLEKDGARMRTWQEAEEFVDRFEKFATRKVRCTNLSRIHLPNLLTVSPEQMGCKAEQALQTVLRHGPNPSLRSQRRSQADRS